jgi:nuclear GTP-binding protein
MTAAKMILHDWQRGKIPFFVPPPRQDALSESEEPNVNGIDVDKAVDHNQASAAIKAIANVLSSQQQRNVPVQGDLYNENELNEETADQLPDTGDYTDEDSDASEEDPSTEVPSEQDPSTDVPSEQLISAEPVPTSES